MKKILILSAILAALLLASCAGGGGVGDGRLLDLGLTLPTLVPATPRCVPKGSCVALPEGWSVGCTEPSASATSDPYEDNQMTISEGALLRLAGATACPRDPYPRVVERTNRPCDPPK